MEYKRKKVDQLITDQENKELEAYSQAYMDFLNKGKTERLASAEIIRQAKAHGFISLEEALKKGAKAGDKIYAENKGKGGVLILLGKDLSEGMDIVGSHIDSPRLDLKALPLMEDGGMAYFRTHYYGGLKKYGWTNLPLALHGLAFNKDGNPVEINIGEDPTDPVFYINDLLIHLSKERLKKEAEEVIKGEDLKVVIGSNSRGQEEKEENPVKKNILALIKEKYGLDEDDFQVAEIEVVPAGPAREVGFDRSMIAAHGHDDRICSYANLRAILDSKPVARTKVALFVDKEEIGSVGNTGMHSSFFANVVAELIQSMKGTYSELFLRRALAHSRVLSADVTATFDPVFPDVFEKENSSMLGCGVCLTKYTGSGGKGGSNDANAEFLNEIRKIFNDHGVLWQTGELGAVDAGGGGTIAYILANLGAEVVDCGTGMLSMHSPIELASKADAYETYRAYRAFFA